MALGGGVLAPLLVLLLVMLLLLLFMILWLLLLLLSPPSSPTLTQPVPYGSIPPCAFVPPTYPNLSSTESATLGSFPNIRSNLVIPTRCAPAPPPPYRATPPAPRGVRLHTTAG